MSNQGYRQIFKWDDANLKQLNDSLRWLYSKVTGRVEMRDLSTETKTTIESKADGAVVEEIKETADTAKQESQQASKDASAAAGAVFEMQGDVQQAVNDSAQAKADAGEAKQTADEAQTAVESMQTSIEQTGKAIALKADKTEVEALAGTVSAQSAELVVQANEIALRVKQETLDAAIDGVQVGGTNLLKGTKTLASTGSTADDWRINRTDMVSVYDGGDGFYRAMWSAAGESSDTWAGVYSPVMKLPEGWQGREVTLSAWIYSDDWAGMDGGGYTPIAWGICLSQGGTTRLNYTSKGLVKPGEAAFYDHIHRSAELADSKWVRAGVTVTLDEESLASGTGDFAANTHIFIQFFLRRNGSWKMYAPKLEFGNRMTDWSPAPEDAELRIDELSAELVVQAGEIEANTQKIETVQGTASANSTNLEVVTKRVTTAEQSISALDEAIVQKVSTEEFNALGERVSANEGSITTQAGKITANTTAVQTAQSTADAAKSAAATNASNLTKVTTRVTTAEQSISALDGKIATKVEQTEFNALGEVVDSHGTLIEQTAEAVTIQAGRTVGGTNYLKGGGKAVSNSVYNIANYYFSDGLKPKAGETMTVRIWGTLGTGKTGFMVYNTNGYIDLATLTNNGDGTYSATFTWKIEDEAWPDYAQTEASQTRLQVYAIPSSVTGVTSTITKIKLEQGDYATDWSPHPEEFTAGSTMVIDEEQIVATTKRFDVNVVGEDGVTNVMTINEDGAVFQSLTAPNVTPRYNGAATLYVDPDATSAQIAAGNYYRSLADAFAALSWRWIPKNVTIHLAAGMTEYGTLTLRGTSGGGWITIKGDSTNHAKLVGKMQIYGFSNPTVVQYIDVDAPVNARGIDITNGYCDISYCVITGRGTDATVDDATNTASVGILAQQGARVIVSACELYDVYRSLYAQTVAQMASSNNKGNCLIGANRTNVFVTGTAPSDSASTWNYSEVGGKVWGSNATVDQGDKPTPETEPTTVYYSYLYSDSYCTGWSYFSDADVRQGRIQTSDDGDEAAVYGAMWFDAATIKSALTGKTIKQASLRLTMMSGVGRGVAVSVEMYGTSTAYSGRSGAPALTTSYGTIASTEPGETVEITIPTAVIDDIVSGTICALVLKSDDTALYKDRTYSKNYARFAGSTSATTSTCPRLTVVYQ